MLTLRPKIEYRIVCADGAHSYTKPNREKAEKAAAHNTTTPYGNKATEPIPAHRGCAPWHVEARVVCPWEPADDAEELAAMLTKDWWPSSGTLLREIKP